MALGPAQYLGPGRRQIVEEYVMALSAVDRAIVVYCSRIL